MGMRIVLTLLVISFNARADWAQDVVYFGCGESTGLAYQDAERKVLSELEVFQTSCKGQGGEFVYNLKKGFCEPSDPSDLWCRDRCPVFGRGVCQGGEGQGGTPFLQQEVTLSDQNQNGVLEAGEEVNVKVGMTNLSPKGLSAQLKSSLSLVKGDSAFTLEQTQAAMGSIASQATNYVTFKLKVRPEAKCGSRDILRFLVNGPNFVYKFSRPLIVGKLVGKPLVFESPGSSLPLTSQGASYKLGIYPSDDEIHQVSLSYTASVEKPKQYRAWITGPDRKPVWAFLPNFPHKEVRFEQDLSEFFPNAKTQGDWFLSGDAKGDNPAAVTSYRLVITPKKVECQ